jgi:hypothetical protein
MSRLSSKKIIRTINKAIALNPTEITFDGTKLIEVDGAYEPVQSTRTITILIYLDDGSSQINIDSRTQGTSYKSNRYKMVADKDANLEVNPKESIKFVSNGDKFEIKAVYPQIVEDIICGYLCDLERYD